MGYALRQKEMIVETSEPEVWILMHDGQNQWEAGVVEHIVPQMEIEGVRRGKKNWTRWVYYIM